MHLTWGSVSKHWRMDRRVTLPDLAHLRSSVRQGLRAIFWHRIRDWSKFVAKLVIKAFSFKNQMLDIWRKEKSYLGRPSKERALLDNKAKVNLQ